jgi:hypothetical protein
MLLIGAILLLLMMAVFEVVLLVFLLSGVRNASPAVMTPPAAVEAVIAALDLPERGLVLEPGCGDGRILEAVLRYRPKLSVKGAENNPVLALLAWRRLRRPGAVLLGDARRMDFRGADRVFLYMSPQFLDALEARLERELAPGARVVSLQYAFSKRQPTRKVEVAGGRNYAKHLYVYDY